MKNILVTGGAGFIGSHTVVELVEAGYRPIIIDDFSNSDKNILGGIEAITKQKITCYDKQFQDADFIEKLCRDEKIDGIIHFAAFKAVGESVEKPLKYYQNNVAGFIELLGTLDRSGVQKIVFSSSCTVYGEPDSLPITEESPIKPATSPYGATKQMCETILQDVIKASSGLRGISLRYFNPIGAHPSGHIGELPLGIPANLVPFITQAAAGIRDQLTVYGDDYPTPDGTCIRDYIHVVDLAKAHIKALEFLDTQSPKLYEICNIGTGKGSSVLEVIKTFEAVSGHKVPFSIGPRRPGDTIGTYAAVDKANRMLKWKAEKTLAEALRDAWQWQSNLEERKA